MRATESSFGAYEIVVCNETNAPFMFILIFANEPYDLAKVINTDSRSSFSKNCMGTPINISHLLRREMSVLNLSEAEGRVANTGPI
jgi:hypothetical protein